MIGSEGILGVVTEAIVKLRPVPKASWTAMISLDRLEDAAATVTEVIAAGLSPAALEMCDRRQVDLCEDWLPAGYPRDAEAILFDELDGDPDEGAGAAVALEPLMRAQDAAVRLARNPEERARMWAGRLSAFHAFKASGKAFYVCDVTVPRQRIPEMVMEARRIAVERDLDVSTVAHVGDGNMHPVILYEPSEIEKMRGGADEIAAAALALGGTLTGEHGIGTEKVRHMRRRFGATEIAAFRTVKSAFDPTGILNPGVLLPAPAPDEPTLPRFSDAVRQALAGRSASAAADARAGELGIDVDRDNLVVTAGGAELCAAVGAAISERGLWSGALDRDGTSAAMP